MEKVLIKNGRLINPATGFDGVTDILIDGPVIKKIGACEEIFADIIIDAHGMWVVPGLIDMHVHFRDPGYEYKEDIFTGQSAAAAGGFTSVCVMPNTKPVTDSAEVVEYIIKKAKQANLINVIPCGSVTKNQAGEELSDIAGMVSAGALALSEDGKSVANSLLLKKALEECEKYQIPMLSHCEDMFLAENGAMNLSETSKRLALSGIPVSSEAASIARDIIIAAETGARLHICHVSASLSVDIIREAKKRGVNVTAEAAPHHFILTDEDINGTDANFKMNPPLRSGEDVTAVLLGLADGTIDCIATDHAPHSYEEKNCGFASAANGIIGLETSLPLCMTYLLKKNILTPSELIEKMSVNPAKILGLNKGSVMEGALADITIIAPNEEYIIDSSRFKSKSKNTPFNGFKVTGRVKYTICGGRVVYNDK